MPDTYRVGKTLGTTIYCNDEPQPCAIVMNCGGITGRELAARIVALLNAESAPIAAVEGPKEWATAFKVGAHKNEITIFSAEEYAREWALKFPDHHKLIYRTPAGPWIDADVQASEEPVCHTCKGDKRVYAGYTTDPPHTHGEYALKPCPDCCAQSLPVAPDQEGK